MHYLILFVCGTLGVIFDCCLKANSLKRKASIGNVPFTVKNYLSEDIISIILSFVSVVIWLLLFGEVATRFAQIENFQRVTFVLMGGFGSHIIQYFFSVAEKKIMNIIDQKTDIADNKTADK